MRRTPRALAAALAAAGLALALAPRAARAIPAFARRYEVSCTLCHGPFPRLKPYGEAFAGRGYALEPGTEPAPTTADTGDELLQLPKDFPLSLRFDGFAQLQGRSPSVDFQAPFMVKLLAGGRIADKVGFFAYLILEEGEPIGFEDAYVQFSDVFRLPLDLIVGQFQIADSIVKRELRLERLDYAILTARVGGEGGSIVDLTYDRGLAAVLHTGPVDSVLTVTNGNGIGEAVREGVFDKDPYKNFSLHVAAALGPVRVGALGFVGKERGSTGRLNTTWYAGPDLVVNLGEWASLTGVYLERHDTDPTFSGAGAVRTRGGFAEAVVFPGGIDGRWALSAIYNKVRSGDPGAEAESAGAALSWLYRRNIRLVAEVDRDVREEAWIGSLGTVAAF